MKTIKFEVNIEQLGGFCPAQVEGYHWEFDADDKHYDYDVVECYFNEDNDNIVEVTVVTSEPDAEPAGIQDGFLWNIEKEYMIPMMATIKMTPAEYQKLMEICKREGLNIEVCSIEQ